MPPIRSLAYRTDLFCLGARSQVVEREGYRVLRSPDHPGFFWGNLLLFERAPRIGDDVRWVKCFETEFADSPEVRHRTFGWDDPEGAPGSAQAFVARGYALEVSRTLCAKSIHAPPKVLEELEVRPLVSDADWSAATENQLVCRDDEVQEQQHRDFKVRRMAEHRSMAEAGMGHGYGAFLDGRLVADLGIYHDGDVARYQQVATHPDFRRRGVCGTLVHRAGQHTLDTTPTSRLVMCAELGAPPERIYRSIGFEPVEVQAGLCWWPRPV